MSRWIIAALIAAGLSRAAGAQASPPPSGATRVDVPAIVTRGLEAYRTGGIGAAADVWLVGSPISSDAARAQLIGALAQLDAAYGHMVGADVVDVLPLGPHVRRVYVVVRMERGPLYGFLECYQTVGGDWIIPSFLFNAKASEILPSRLLGG